MKLKQRVTGRRDIKYIGFYSRIVNVVQIFIMKRKHGTSFYWRILLGLFVLMTLSFRLIKSTYTRH